MGKRAAVGVGSAATGSSERPAEVLPGASPGASLESPAYKTQTAKWNLKGFCGCCPRGAMTRKDSGRPQGAPAAPHLLADSGLEPALHLVLRTQGSRCSVSDRVCSRGGGVGLEWDCALIPPEGSKAWVTGCTQLTFSSQ